MKPLKPLDPFRPNLLPKAVSNDKTTDYNIGNNVVQANQREYVKELVERSKIGKNDRSFADNYTEEDIESMVIPYYLYMAYSNHSPNHSFIFFRVGN